MFSGGEMNSEREAVSNEIFLLWFVPEDESDDNGLLIGVYDSEPAARAAIERVKNKPGFAEYPRGFQIHPRELGRDSWTDGFVRD
jgi:homoserine kinase type II